DSYTNTSFQMLTRFLRLDPIRYKYWPRIQLLTVVAGNNKLTTICKYSIRHLLIFLLPVTAVSRIQLNFWVMRIPGAVVSSIIRGLLAMVVLHLFRTRSMCMHLQILLLLSIRSSPTLVVFQILHSKHSF